MNKQNKVKFISFADTLTEIEQTPWKAVRAEGERERKKLVDYRWLSQDIDFLFKQLVFFFQIFHRLKKKVHIYSIEQ